MTNIIADDAAALTLFRQWRAALDAANACHEDDGGPEKLDEKLWAIEQQVFDTPMPSAIGMAVKACVLVYHEKDIADEPSYSSDGHLDFETHAIRGLAVDVAHLLPEAKPLVEWVLDVPLMRPSPGEAEMDELRARAEALVAEYDAPLPEGDAGLIEAERRMHELDPRREALAEGLEITPEIEDEITTPVFVAMCDLDTRIATTPAVTLAGAAVKLRRLLHPDLGMDGTEKETDLPCLHQILSVIEQEAQS
jgi:hypothetical protein